jgi:pseudouridine-5'-monophosphatase
LFVTAEETPGSRRFVESLLERDVPLGVATSSERELYRLKTGHHDWFSAFRAVVCGDDPRVGRLKPAPDIFLVTAEELGAEPKDCLVFEDSLAGVLAARAANMQVIAVVDPNLDASRYREADAVVRSFAELRPADLGL